MLPEYLEGDNKENDTQAYADATFRSVFYKMMELRAIRALADKSLKEGMEVIFLGDFNEHVNGSIMSILKSSVLDEMRFWDVLTKYEKDKTTHIHRSNRLTFDTILVSSGLQNYIGDTNVYNGELKDYSMLQKGDIETVVEPDHAMVTLTLN